ncbi:EAL domain-containing protein [bacterium]|nr:EAL domain-containing protein [bacterium]
MTEPPEPEIDVNLGAGPEDRPHVTLKDLGAYRDSQFPVWVLDVDHFRIVWANDAAVDLWAAGSAAELMQRDLSLDMTSTIQTRLRNYTADLWKGAHFDEEWTLFPRGMPRTVLGRLRGCLLGDGRMAILCEGQVIKPNDANMLRASQALLYTTMMVTTYAEGGQLTYANPAARRAFAGFDLSAASRFQNPELRAVLKAAPEAAREGIWRSAVITTQGPRIHEVEVRQSFDPVEGRRNFLLTELDVTAQEAVAHELSNLAMRDGLTGLRNRAHLTGAAPDFIANAAQAGQTAGLFLLDVDRFKLVNDSLGHAAGDTLLQEISRRLTEALPGTVLLARLGGDEFCCLLTTGGGEKVLASIASHLLRDMRRPLQIEGNDLSVSVSIGLSIADSGQTTFPDLLHKADLALFDAKAKGGNRLRMFRPELAERNNRFLQLDAELRDALRLGRLELYYQPRISFQTGKIVAAEALIRLNSPTGSQVLPGEFIPIAEATGRIAAIGRWVLAEATRHLVRLRGIGHAINLSVNVSPKQFADPSFLALLRQVRPAIEEVSGEIELEITENVLIENDQRLQRVLAQISRLGYRLAIDDFGTAYSNLASLTRYPISCLKVDRTLVAHKDFRLILTGVMTLARAYGAKIVAEGVETTEQHAWLAENLCDEYQGYLFSGPVPFAELQRMVNSGQ